MASISTRSWRVAFRKLLRGAGYSVTSVTPDLECEAPAASSSADTTSTEGVSSERSRVKAEVKKAKKAKGDIDVADAGVQTIEGIYNPSMADADVVVDVRVRSLYADIVPFSSLLWPFIQSWMLSDVYVYAPGEGTREVALGRSFRSYCSVPWAPIDFGGETSYNTSVNRCVRRVLRKMEKTFCSEAFAKAVTEARAPQVVSAGGD